MRVGRALGGRWGQRRRSSLVSDTNSLKPKKSARRRRQKRTSSQVTSRRSNRVSKKTPLFTGLTDAFFNAEENEAQVREPPAAVDRMRRATKPTKTFEKEFGYDEVKQPRKKARASVDAPATNEQVDGSPAIPQIPMIVRWYSRGQSNVDLASAPASAFWTGQVWRKKGARGCVFKCPLCNHQWSAPVRWTHATKSTILADLLRYSVL